jgi:aldehyde:ferredoxin oxidoreductase
MKGYRGRILFIDVTRPTPQYAQGYDRRGTEGKPEFAIRNQHFTAADDSLVLCRFTSERGFGLVVEEPYARMIRAVTGWDMGVEELERVGERVINLERLFNVREGVRRKDDVLPWRVMHEPIPDGPSAGMYCPSEELSAMLDRYYALRGWDQDGVPTKAPWPLSASCNPSTSCGAGLHFPLPHWGRG